MPFQTTLLGTRSCLTPCFIISNASINLVPTPTNEREALHYSFLLFPYHRQPPPITFRAFSILQNNYAIASIDQYHCMQLRVPATPPRRATPVAGHLCHDCLLYLRHPHSPFQLQPRLCRHGGVSTQQHTWASRRMTERVENGSDGGRRRRWSKQAAGVASLAGGRFKTERRSKGKEDCTIGKSLLLFITCKINQKVEEDNVAAWWPGGGTVRGGDHATRMGGACWLSPFCMLLLG
nr:hypothetical protein Iba_chr09fCG8660 [Ipomoea batatas]